MKTIDEKLEEVVKTMLKEFKRGQCNEVTNNKYRELLKEKNKVFKNDEYYKNQFKPKDYNIKLK